MVEEKTERQFQDILSYYKEQEDRKEQNMILALLKEVQELYGCIPVDKQDQISRELGLSSQVVRKLIKLCPSLKSTACLHRVTVCTGARCGRKSAGALLEAVRKEAAKRGPGVFEIVTRDCVKQCGTAPNMLVDGKLYAHVTPQEVPAILERHLNATKNFSEKE